MKYLIRKIKKDTTKPEWWTPEKPSGWTKDKTEALVFNDAALRVCALPEQGQWEQL